MKHTLTVAVCFILIIGTSVLVYTTYRSNEAQSYLKRVKDAAMQVGRDNARKSVIDNEKARIKLECDKETNYYSQLTPKQKTTLPIPNCNLQMIE